MDDRAGHPDAAIAGVLDLVPRTAPRVQTAGESVPAQPPPEATASGEVLTATGAHGPLSGLAWAGFQVGDLIGAGGMGEVYRAHQAGLERVVALKVLPDSAGRDPLLRQRFAAEAKAAARVRDPRVVAVHDAGECAGRLWLAMEYVAGRSLDQVIRERRLAGRRFTPLEAAGLALHAARGLAAAHRERLVHRDVKPANLLVTPDGLVKVTDFGLVRILDDRALTSAGTVLGTPLYLSPEQGRGLPAEAPADVYGLGVVLYELLTLQPPFTGATTEDLVAQHNFTEPPLPSSIDPDIPGDLQAICLKCLQKDPARRFPDAGALADDLDRLRLGLAPLSAVFAPGELGTGAAEAIRRLAGRRRHRLTALLAILAAVALAIGWWWWDARKAEVGAVRARLEPLARVQAIPATAGEDVERLARLVGDADPQVVQGRGKLALVARLTAAIEADPTGSGALAALAGLGEAVGPAGDPRLARWRGDWEAAAGARSVAVARFLDAADPSPDERRDAVAALAWLEERHAAADGAAQRMRLRLESIAVEVASLRHRLAALDAPRTLPADVGNALARYERLAGFDDPQATTWRRRYEAVRALHARLEALDRVADPPPDAAADLERLIGLVGSDDPQVAVWSAKLAAVRELKVRLGAALDPAQPVPPGSADNLARLERLIGVDAPDPVRWRGKLAEIAHLHAELAIWEEMVVLPADQLAAATTALAECRRLVGEDEVVQRATARLVVLRGPGRPAWASNVGHDGHGPWAEFQVGQAVQRLRWLPPLTCPIGSAVGEAGHEDDEALASVRFSRGLWVADRECTQALWAAVTGAWPAMHRDPRLPVEQVSRRDCEAFCAKLAEGLPGAVVRLPGEAEWEAAVRGGIGGTWAGLDMRQVGAAVIHAGSGLEAPAPAGSGVANLLGIHDGPGNLREWCRGAYGPPLVGLVADPQPAVGDQGVVRGGSWADPLLKCRPANRAPLDPDARSPALGFRLVIEP